jgi:hypothetical protein
MSFKKIFIVFIALSLTTACASKNKIEMEGQTNEGPSGTVIGNPAPKPWTLRVSSADGNTRYIINIYERGRTEVTVLNQRGDVVEKVSSAFALTRTPSALRVRTLALEAEVEVEEAHRFEMNITFSDGSDLRVVLTTNDDTEITSVTVEVNDVAVIVEVELTEDGGEIRTITLIFEDEVARVCLSPFDEVNTAAEDNFQEAMDLLEEGLIPQSLEKFEAVLSLVPDHAEASFGSALTQLILLPESEAAVYIQNGLGVAHLTHGDLFGEGSYLEMRNDYNRGVREERVGCEDRTRFPYMGCIGPYPHSKLSFNRILAHATPGFGGRELQDGLRGIFGMLESIVQRLESARLCEEFEFTIPGRLFYTNTDIPVSHTDLTMFTATQYMNQFASILPNVWRMKIELGLIFDENGNRVMSNDYLLSEMNRFFYVRSTTALLEARSKFFAALDTALEGFAEMPTTSSYGLLERVPETADGLDALRGTTQSLINSFEGMTRIAGVSQHVTGGGTGLFVAIPPEFIDISIDLDSFFSDLPDLDEIGIDPFVLEDVNGTPLDTEDDKIKPVESFFQAMADRFMDGYIVDERLHLDFMELFHQTFANSLLDELVDFKPGEGIEP